jgi:hypothetical protein
MAHLNGSLPKKERMALKMNKEFFFDEELEEKYFERIESKLEKSEMESLREKYDAGWDKPIKLSLRMIS